MKMRIIGYYWNDATYDRGQVWGFDTMYDAQVHAKENQAQGWDGEIVVWDTDVDGYLDIYTGE
jgi:hypothetical protein